ncbi:MAG: Hpt domain-containing protein, partial [Roseicyclus sp.]
MRSESGDLERELRAILGAARAEFLAALPERIAQIDALLGDLERGGDVATLAALRAETHRIAGLCGSIGLDPLAREGTRAEEVLRPLALGTAPAESAALGRARDAVLAVRAGLVMA